MEEKDFLLAIKWLRCGIIPSFVLPEHGFCVDGDEQGVSQTHVADNHVFSRLKKFPKKCFDRLAGFGATLDEQFLMMYYLGVGFITSFVERNFDGHFCCMGACTSVDLSNLSNELPEFNITNFIKSVKTILDGGMKIKSTLIIDNLKSTVDEMQKKMGWDLSDLRTLLGKKSIEMEQMRMAALNVKPALPPCRFTQEQIGDHRFCAGQRDILIAIMDSVMADNPEHHADCVFAFLAVLRHKNFWNGSANQFNALCSRLWKTPVKDSALTKFLRRNGNDFDRWGKSNVINERRLIAKSFFKMISQNIK